MYELLEAYRDQDLADNVFGPSAITKEMVEDPYQVLDYSTVAPVFDSILLNVDSLQDLCRLNGKLQLVNPWGLGETFAAQGRSGTLLEYWARLQSLTRLMVSRWNSSLSDDGKIVTVLSDWSQHPSVGFSTLGASFSAHRIKDIFGVAPIYMRMPYQSGRTVHRRLAAEFPDVRMDFEPPLQMISYDRAEILAAAPIPRTEGPKIGYRDLLDAYYPANRRKAAIAVQESIESMIEAGIEPSLESVAAAVSAPPRELQRALASGGLSMRSATERIRVALAEDILADTDDLILDVALATGYTSHQALTKVFKRWRGLAPTEFRYYVERNRAAEEVAKA
jgi:AraC-like DNA-binding protein